MGIPVTRFQSTQCLLCLFFSHALDSMDVVVGNMANGCLLIHERKFYPKKGQKAIYKGCWISVFE